eukprot:1140558-Pelagomonas_calceolata.AAC.2
MPITHLRLEVAFAQQHTSSKGTQRVRKAEPLSQQRGARYRQQAQPHKCFAVVALGNHLWKRAHAWWDAGVAHADVSLMSLLVTICVEACMCVYEGGMQGLRKRMNR